MQYNAIISIKYIIQQFRANCYGQNLLREVWYVFALKYLFFIAAHVKFVPFSSIYCVSSNLSSHFCRVHFATFYPQNPREV